MVCSKRSVSHFSYVFTILGEINTVLCVPMEKAFRALNLMILVQIQVWAQYSNKCEKVSVQYQRSAVFILHSTIVERKIVCIIHF